MGETTASAKNLCDLMNDMTIPAARQKTLRSRINCSGVGLHSGRRVMLTIGPAATDTGIQFKRTDAAGNGAVIPARWDRVVDTRLCTVIGNGDGVVVSTVEHLMAAFAGLGIDNATVEIDGPEVPIMDGSADAFVFLIECAGIVEQSRAAQAHPHPEIHLGRRREGQRHPGAGAVRRRWTSRSTSPIRRSARRKNRSASRKTPSSANCRAPAPSASPRKSSCCGRPAWPAAARWTMPSSSAPTGC